jgi:hypothetical protein
MFQQSIHSTETDRATVSPAAGGQRPDMLLDPRRLLRHAYAANRSLTILSVLMLAALIVTLIGLMIDPRVITGAPAWMKPFKFAVSIMLYSGTLLWMLSFVQGRRWLVGIVSFVSLVGFLIEMAAIVLQVVRNTTSHFNAATPFDEMIFNLMGGFVMLIWIMNLLAAILLLFQRLPNPVLAWSVRLGLLLTLVGGATGALMTMPTAAQSDAMINDQPVSIVGAHSVGVPDGGPGLPVVGWSTTGGDLRIGHFVGLHALQVMPLIGWLVRRRAGRLRGGHQVGLIWIAGLGYLGLIGLLIWQALRGQPLLAPDVTTLTALGALIGAVVLAGGTAVALGLSHAADQPLERAV